MTDYLPPIVGIPLTLIAWTLLAIIIRTEVRRERASSQAALDHPCPEAQGHARAATPTAVRGVRQASDHRPGLAGRAPHTGRDGRQADSREHRSRAHQLQPQGGRQARSEGDELATPPSAGYPRLVTR